MNKTLLIDDVRTLKVNTICRTYTEGLKALKDDDWDEVYLDHDLGETKTGYDILCSLIKSDWQKRPKKILLITSNPVGKKNIEGLLIQLGYQLIGDKLLKGSCSRKGNLKSYNTKFIATEWLIQK